MTKHILFDALTGKLAARYDSEIHGDNIPAEAIAVPDELFFQTINEQDGLWSLVDGEIVKLPFPAKALSEVKSDKLNEIRAAYDAATLAPVEALGFVWDGGFDSAIKLDAAMRLSQAAGAPSVTFYDTSNVGHDLSFDDAMVVCISVAVAFQAALGKKQALFAQVNAATSKTKTEAITW